MNDDSMIKYSHRLSAQESIGSFISYLEESIGTTTSKKNKDWLYKKGQEVFDNYYIDEQIKINLVEEEDKQLLLEYFSKIQDTLGKMFAHIMLTEFRLYLMENDE